MKINGFGKATDVAIRQFEKHIGFTLPDDYKQFLAEHNGGTVNDYISFKVEELDEIIPMDVFYGIEVDSELELQGWFDEYKDDLLPCTIIIGSDPGGGMIVLINDPASEEDNGIYYYDHAYYFEKSSDECNIYKIADSFQEFINGLKEPEE